MTNHGTESCTNQEEKTVILGMGREKNKEAAKKQTREILYQEWTDRKIKITEHATPKKENNPNSKIKLSLCHPKVDPEIKCQAR